MDYAYKTKKQERVRQNAWTPRKSGANERKSKPHIINDFEYGYKSLYPCKRIERFHQSDVAKAPMRHSAERRR